MFDAHNIFFRSLLSCSTVCWEPRFPNGFVFLFALPHDTFEKLIINHNWINRQMSRAKICAKNNIYVALVLLLQQARQKYRVETAASSKTEKSDRSECRVVNILQIMCNQNKNSTRLIGGSQGFVRCAQIWLATKIGGATAIQKLWVKRTVEYWSPVGTSIAMVQMGENTPDIVVSSMFSTCDADRMWNSILQIPWCHLFYSPAFHFHETDLTRWNYFDL